MTTAAAVAFLDSVEADETFATELARLEGDPAAVLARVHNGGFDVTHAEVRDAFLARYGNLLSPEQLEHVTAGVKNEEWLWVGLGLGAAGVGIAAAGAAAVA